MIDQAAEPLIADNDYDAQLISSVHESTTTRKLSWFMWTLTLSAGISGLLFGYDTGVISATLITINDSLSNRFLTTLDKSVITASTSLCALIISPVSGTLCDRFGRKITLAASSLLFVLGAASQAFATQVWVMVLGRGVVGFAVGSASFVTPLYIAELAPKEFRGRLVTLNVGLITAGQVVAYIVGWAFAVYGGIHGWRWMVGLGALPAILQAVLLIAMPESPRWLIKEGAKDKAREVFARIYGQGSNHEVELVLTQIEAEIAVEEEARRTRIRGRSTKANNAWFGETWTQLFGVPGHRRALVIACLLQGIQQLCGFNSLMYFSATIFDLLHFSTPTLTSLSVAITNLFFTLLSLILIDRLGRRKILLLSIPIMTLSLLACAFFFTSIDLGLSSPTPSTTPTPAPTNTTTPLLILLSIIIYVASYAVGIGNVPWQQSELFPLSVRSLGSSLSTATNWGGNFIVGITFLPMLEFLSPTITFTVYAMVCAAGWVAIWCIYPETCGLSLEEVAVMLREGWGVK